MESLSAALARAVEELNARPRQRVSLVLRLEGALLAGALLAGAVGALQPAPRAETSRASLPSGVASRPMPTSPPPGEEVHATVLANPSPARALPLDETTPVGTVTIPRLGIHRAPIFQRGLDAKGQMKVAPGYSLTHYAFSQVPGEHGNAVLYGHDDIEGSIFRYLHHLQPGDTLAFETPERAVSFRVTGKTIVTPDRVDILNDTPTPRLTLFTCYPYWVDTHRLVVFAEPEPEEAPRAPRPSRLLPL